MAASSVGGNVRRHLRWYRWLLVMPFVWQLGLAPAVNGVRLVAWGVPFPMLWQMLGVAFTSAVIAVVFRMDRRTGADREEPAIGPDEGGER